jgi:endoglucanase
MATLYRTRKLSGWPGLLGLLLGAGLALGQTNPVRLAKAARIDLAASFSVSTLDRGRILDGGGSIMRMTWLAPNDQPRTYTVSFPILHFATNDFALTFVPTHGGTVELKLMGPWEEVAPGAIYEEDVYWDALRVTGASMVGDAWRKLSKPVRAWHNAPEVMTLHVDAGNPVTLHLQAHSVLPPGFTEMKRIVSRDTPAHRAAKKFMRGTNLGNYLEAPPNQNWVARYTADDFIHIHDEGFDHVRLPIAWHLYAGPAPDFKLSDEIYSKADFLVTNAFEHGLNVIVNIHHFNEFYRDPAGQKEKLYAIWRQLTAHYASFPDRLAFELVNEPMGEATTTVLNPIYAEVIRQIHKTSPHRTLFLGPGKWNSIDELGDLSLPDDDDNLIVTVHCYDPFFFTHQGATWAGRDTRVTGIVFPGPPATPLVPDSALELNPRVLDWIQRYNTLPTDQNPCSVLAFRGKLRQARQWSDYYGRPVHVGEFGCYEKADPQSRARFYAAFRQTLDDLGLGWAMWDWKAGFKYWDTQADGPAPGMRQALFPGRN